MDKIRFEGSNTVVKGAFSPDRLAQIADNQYFGLDIKSAVKLLEDKFNSFGLTFDKALWANLTLNLSAGSKIASLGEAEETIKFALETYGINLILEDKEFNEFVNAILVAYGFQLEN